MTHVYPAIFTKCNEGGYSISFPDLPECNSQGEDLKEAISMATDSLCQMLYYYEEENKTIPRPTESNQLKLDSNQISTLIKCDTITYRKKYDTKSMNKTVTLPIWLNTMAENACINFSAVLQKGLKKLLEIDEDHNPKKN